MARIEFEGETVELAEDWRIGELIRAENALDIDMDSAKTAARTALVVYISMARLEKWKPGTPGNRGLADTVMRMDITSLAQDDEDEEGDATGPPVLRPVDPTGGLGSAEAESEDQQTIGAPHSASSA